MCGAVYVDYDADECTLSDCSFIDCSSSSFGGGAVMWNAANGALSGCSFINCSALNGGAVYLEYGVNECTFSDCSFKGCTADECGGGIYVFGDGINCSVINSVFKGNSAQSGADFYSEGSLNLVNVTVDKMSTAVISDSYLSMGYGGSAKLIITLKNINNNNIVANSPISIMFNNKEYTKTTDSKGQASLDMPTNLAVGDYEATISYKGNSKYYPASTTTYVYVHEMDTQISAIHNDENKELVATLTTIDGKAIGSVNVVANLNGKNSTLKTDSKGQVKLSTADLKSGRNTAKFTYKGSSGKYQQSTKSINVYVNDDVSVRTFIDLMNEIDNAGSQLKLTRNYTYDASCDSEDCPYGINIEKTIEIDGNGYTINGNGKVIAFRISGSDVVLRNINFLNCSFYGNGGTIYWGGEASGANGVLSNCTFVNSSSEGSGGAVYWNAPNGVISDCIFENCYADVSGGAVLWTGYHKNATVTGCSFVNCHSGRVGGAVSGPGDDGTLTNCHFENCYSETGGAVYLNENSLSDCSFVNCHSNSVGGAIYWSNYYGNYYVSGSSFIDCSADEDGGAVYSIRGNNALISDCSFMGCSADGSGGAVYWTDSNESVVKSSFTNCHASRNGGGIYFNGENCSLIDSTFKGNTASEGSDWYGVYPVNVANKTSVGTVISAPSISTTYGVSKNLVATLKDVNGNILAGQQISIALNNVEYKLETNSKGKASLAIPTNLLPATYVATITYAGNVEFDPSSTTANVVVNKMDTSISAVCNSGEIVATLTNINGKAISGASVQVKFNGETTSAKTNSKGQITVPIPSGTNTATISYKGNSKYKSTSTSIDISDKTSIIISAVYDANNKEIVATLTNGATGNAVSSANVQFDINGAVTTVKTNTKGQAKLSTADLPLGTYNAIISYAGNSKYSPASTSISFDVKTKVIVTDVYAYSDRIVAKLTNGATGKAIANANMIVEINGVKYNAKSDNKGQLTFDTTGLDLPSAYDLTISYRGNDRYTASSATVAVDLNKANMMITTNYHADKQKMVATLKNSKTGKIVSNANMIIDLNGVKTTYKSNDQGKITLPTADFAPGTYVGTVTYPGNARYNSISAVFKIDI